MECVAFLDGERIRRIIRLDVIPPSHDDPDGTLEVIPTVREVCRKRSKDSISLNQSANGTPSTVRHVAVPAISPVNDLPDGFILPENTSSSLGSEERGTLAQSPSDAQEGVRQLKCQSVDARGDLIGASMGDTQQTEQEEEVSIYDSGGVAFVVQDEPPGGECDCNPAEIPSPMASGNEEPQSAELQSRDDRLDLKYVQILLPQNYSVVMNVLSQTVLIYS